MIAAGSYVIYKVAEEIPLTTDMSKILIVVNNLTELPNVYSLGQKIMLVNDFLPLRKDKIYVAIANQKNNFNAAEWTLDIMAPYTSAITAAQIDGDLATAISDGKIIITKGSSAPLNPAYYDIWQRSAADVTLGELSADDAEAFIANGAEDVYFYFGLDNLWHMCNAAMKSAILGSNSTAVVKSQASVWNKVNVGGVPYINGWQSIIEYENNHLLKNDFAIIADNFYIGAVGNVVQNGVDSAGQPIYESTGEAYKAFEVDMVNHKIKFDGVVDFTNTNSFGTTTLNGGKITTNTLRAVDINTNTAMINATLQSSDFTDIGGAGFRLKSNAAGTSADPTIYGAYIRGATIDSSTTNVRDIKVITDSGYECSTIFFAEASLSGGMYHIPVVSYDYAGVNLNRVSKLSGSRHQILSPVQTATGTSGITVSSGGWIVVATGFAIGYANSTLSVIINSVNIGNVLSGDVSGYGFTFRLAGNSGWDSDGPISINAIFMRPYGEISNFTMRSEITIKLIDNYGYNYTGINGAATSFVMIGHNL